MDIKNLSNRELDELMVGIMGWKIALWRDVDWIVDEQGNHIASCQDWSPSTKIADAWQVIEKLKERGFVVYLFDQLGYDTETEEGDLWRVGFKDVAAYEADDDRPRHEIWLPTGEAKTAWLAICLAALETIGVKRESRT